MKPSVRAALDDARRRLAGLYGDRLARVVLYGSQARGDARDESDVNVLVILRGPFNLYAEIKRLVRLQTELLDRYGELVVFQPFEREIYDDLTHPLMMNVHEEGIELFSKTPPLRPA